MLRIFTNTLKSFFFFCSGIIIKRKFDVVFYYPQHFNRGVNSENQYFKQLLQSCDTNNVTYIVFEEPDFTIKGKRNYKAIPFDFLYLFTLFLRKFYNREKPIQSIDQKIGRFIAKIFFKNLHFKSYITLSQSMLSVFRGINPNAILYDLQHGIIHNNKINYLVDGKAESNLVDNNVHLLLSGESYKNVLVSNEIGNYFQNHAFVVGSNIQSKNILHEKFNYNILITLQFTHDHTSEQNELFFAELYEFIRVSNKDVNFYLKHHPRFNNEVDLSEILKQPNINIAPSDINSCFDLCSLHATAYSTSTFDAALLGIPTILIPSESKFNYFQKDFNYPLNQSIDNFKDNSFYREKSKIIKEWATAYYTTYNESKFLNLLR